MDSVISQPFCVCPLVEICCLNRELTTALTRCKMFNKIFKLSVGDSGFINPSFSLLVCGLNFQPFLVLVCDQSDPHSNVVRGRGMQASNG